MDTAFPDLVVLVGSGRSGSVYLSGLLKQSYDIGFSGEPKFVVPLSRRLRRFGDLRDPDNLRRLVDWIHEHAHPFHHLHETIGIPSRPQEIIDRVIEPTYTGVLYAVFQLLADKRGRSRLGYRDPFDVANLPEVARLLPTARFVHIIRDGRDVARSYIKFDWGPTNLYAGATMWSDRVAKARRDGRALGERYFELRLEDLVTDPDRVVEPLGSYVGATPAQIDAFREMLSRTSDPASIGVWQREMAPEDRRLCEAVAGRTLRDCGYETSDAADGPVPVARRAWYVGTDRVTRLKRRAVKEASRVREQLRV